MTCQSEALTKDPRGLESSPRDLSSADSLAGNQAEEMLGVLPATPASLCAGLGCPRSQCGRCTDKHNVFLRGWLLETWKDSINRGVGKTRFTVSSCGKRHAGDNYYNSFVNSKECHNGTVYFGTIS